ncbi:MAG: hypothetical protein JWN70_3064 [Planctomycetaceae bacterium]|nr:hypothetical protein [Planctomycetaceae bacterium]
MPTRSTAILIGLSLVFSLPCPAISADLQDLPSNTFVEIKTHTDQPADPAEKGQYARQGWNKILYDPDGHRVLLYDRWIDKKHGGYTIYGNCLFALDPASGALNPRKMDNWTKVDTKEGGYRTLALPENRTEPTPCPRHVYHAFEYVPNQKAIYLCNGANQTVLDLEGKLVGHDECDGAWKLNLKTNQWSRIKSAMTPVNRLDEAMAYSPEANALVYSAADGQIWFLDLDQGHFRKSKESPPKRTAMGRTIFHDPQRKRMILAGGGALDAWTKGPAPEFREIYAFDPVTESVTRLADAPTALYSSHLAYDSKRDLFFAVAVFNKGEQPSGMFAYDPANKTWLEVKTTNAIPPHNNWFGWMQMCYDSDHDCLICKVNEKFFAFRYEER